MLLFQSNLSSGATPSAGGNALGLLFGLNLQIPSTPTKTVSLTLVETDRLAGVVTLYWNAPAINADSYNIEDDEQTLVLGATSPQVISGLQVDTVHSFKVVAFFGGVGVQSNEVAFQFGSNEFGSVDYPTSANPGTFQ